MRTTLRIYSHLVSETHVDVMEKLGQRPIGTLCRLVQKGTLKVFVLVEPMGFEPTTSSMPSRRAPNCATAPPNF